MVNLSKVSIAGLSTIRMLSMKTNAPPLSVRVTAKKTTVVLRKQKIEEPKIEDTSSLQQKVTVSITINDFMFARNNIFFNSFKATQ